VVTNFLRLYKVAPKSSNAPKKLHLILRLRSFFYVFDVLKSSSLNSDFHLKGKEKSRLALYQMSKVDGWLITTPRFVSKRCTVVAKSAGTLTQTEPTNFLSKLRPHSRKPLQ
jgi:hypothetical protein